MAAPVYYIVALALALWKAGALTGEPFKVLDVDTGADTKIEGNRVELVQDARKWRSTYMEHMEISPFGPPPTYFEVPTVDFKKNVVLVVVLGVRAQTDGYQVAGFEEETDAVRLNLAPIAARGNTVNVASTPYAFFVLPRTAKKLEVQLQVGRGSEARLLPLGSFPATLKG